MLFLNQHRVQGFGPAGTIGGVAILFTEAFFNQTPDAHRYLQSSLLFNDPLKVTCLEIAQNNKPFSDLVQFMQWELTNIKDNSQASILHNLLHNFLLYVEREYRPQTFTELKKNVDLDYLLLFRDLLEKSYINEKQVQFYARHLLVTEKHLNQATSKMVGKTPKEMIDERVMLEAKRLLVYTRCTIKEICYGLGYDEPTNFIKYFRKHSGQTPVEFRESIVLE